MEQANELRTGIWSILGRLLTGLRGMLLLENNGKMGFAQNGTLEASIKSIGHLLVSFLARSDLERLLKSFGYINVKPPNRAGKHSALRSRLMRWPAAVRLRRDAISQMTGPRRDSRSVNQESNQARPEVPVN